MEKRYGVPVKLVPKWSNKLNVRLYESIQKVAVRHQQMMTNVMSFEASGLPCLDSPISGKDKSTPRPVMLTLKGLEAETKNECMFISAEKTEMVTSCHIIRKNTTAMHPQ